MPENTPGPTLIECDYTNKILTIGSTESDWQRSVGFTNQNMKELIEISWAIFNKYCPDSPSYQQLTTATNEMIESYRGEALPTPESIPNEPPNV